MTPGERVGRIRLARAEGVGPIAFRRLLDRYGDAEAAIAALPELARAGGRGRAPRVPSAADAGREEAAVAAIGGRLLVQGEPDYPPLLALLADAPPLFAVLGDVSALSARAVALVGARNASVNGSRMAETLAEGVASAGLVVVSGLARGVDAAAHRGALRATAGRTVAAVAGGLDCPYPPEHAGLQAAIAAQGAVLSEAPLGTAPQARHFPRRNRVIAGLALGCVVVEAAPRSGSLLTARLAQEAGREIFAVPGSPLDPRARGCNDLLRQGATLTETAADVLDNLPDHPAREGVGRLPLFRRRARGFAEGAPGFEPTVPEPDPAPAVMARARADIPDLLDAAPVSVDELIRRCHFPATAVITVLLELELAGRVETLPGNRVARIAEPPYSTFR